MDLPLCSAGFIAFALTLYLVLDGFDLGVGILLPFQSDQSRRDRMIDAIAPTWDGNETWLIMAGVGLLAGFPIAYGILMPALYLPLLLMLLSLGMRGVAFEFRVQQHAWRQSWDRVFGLGSMVATLAQGLAGGALLMGVSVKDQSYAGGALDWLSGFSVLTAFTHLAGYTLLGSAWLYLKGTTVVRDAARRQLGWLPIVFAGLAAASILRAAQLQPGVGQAFGAHPAALGVLGMVFFGSAGVTVWLARRARLPWSSMPSVGLDRVPFLLGTAMYGCIVAALALAVFPDIVPFRLSLWQAASTTSSHLFLLTGAAVATPVVIAYSVFAYWIFRGKTPELGLG